MSDRSLNDQRYRACLNFRNMVRHGAALRNHTAPPVHDLMADFIQGAQPKYINRTKVILGFRYLAKSWMLRQWVKFRWLRCPWMQFIVHSSNDEMAEAFVRAIKDELAYDPLMAHLVPEPTTSHYEFNLRGIRPEQGTSIRAAGLRTSLLGARADGYLFDDPEPDVDPEAWRDRLLAAFSEAGSVLHPADRHLALMQDEIGEIPKEVPLPEQAQTIVVGQPHCETTAYIPRDEELEEDGEGHPLATASFLVVPALQSNGEWTWPDQMHRKYYDFGERRPMTITEVKRSMTLRKWELEYQINVDYALKAGPVLRLKEITFSTERVENAIMIVDPADSEEGCEWAIAIGGILKQKAHLSYLGGMHGEAAIDPDIPIGQSVYRTIFDIAHEFGVVRVYFEKNLKAAAVACRRYIQLADVTVTVEEYSAKVNKLRRICEALEQPVNNGMVSMHPQVMADRDNRRQFERLRWTQLPRPNDRLDMAAELVNRVLEEPAVESPHDDKPNFRQEPPQPAAGSFARVKHRESAFSRLNR